MDMHETGWTDDRVAVLKKMYRDGASSGEIARALGGGATRNAVIGKITRLKLDRRGASAVRAEKATGKKGSAGKYRGTVAAARKARRGDKHNNGGLAFKIAQARKDNLSLHDAMDAILKRPNHEAGNGLLDNPIWEALPGLEPIGLLYLNEHTCKWPIGNAPILFCGQHSDVGTPYCAHHRRIASGGRVDLAS